LTAAEY
jgi:hypothetical protein